MSETDEDPERVVEGEVVGGVPPRAPREPQPRGRSFFHPLSGALILAVDWLAFGLDWASGFVLLAVVALLAFGVTYVGVELIQRKLHGDAPRKAALKALLGALAAGVPFPVAGTIVGAAILALSGLPTGRGLRK